MYDFPLAGMGYFLMEGCVVSFLEDGAPFSKVKCVCVKVWYIVTGSTSRQLQPAGVETTQDDFSFVPHMWYPAVVIHFKTERLLKPPKQQSLEHELKIPFK